jgi:hypothetical protein
MPIKSVRAAHGCLAPVLLGAFLLCLHAPRSQAAVPPLSPSNGSAAFRQITLLSPSSGTGYALNAGHPKWPLLLDDPALIRAIGGSDTVLIASTRSHGVSISLDGSVTYTLPPNTYANRVGTILTANDWVSALDGTLPVLMASFTFGDGRHWGVGTFSDVMLDEGKAFNTVYQVRNWSNQVAPTRPDFVMPPRDPHVFQLYAGLGTSGIDSVFSDLQTFNIPDTLRNTTLSSVTFSSYSLITGTTATISGCVVWPDFQIRNRHGGGLGLQTQFDGTYSGRAYGGFIVRDTLFGSRRTFGGLGCMLSCMAMANSYAGDSVTVLELNDYLAKHNGYTRSAIVFLDQVGGQDPGATVTWNMQPGTKLKAGDTLVVESPGALQRTNPLVTLVTGSTLTQGTIVRRHRSGVLTKGMQAGAYGNVRADFASLGYSKTRGRPWHLSDLGADAVTTPRRTEAALADSIPVLLQVAGTPTHFVLARGRRPSLGTGFALGTYLLNDPGHSGVVRLNQIYPDVHSVPRSFANEFFAARACVPDDSSHYSPASLDVGGVAFTLHGGGRLGITTPEGHFLYYNGDAGAYVGDIANVDAWPDYGADLDDDDPANSDDPVDYVQLNGGGEGDYHVVVNATAPATFGLSATTYDSDGNGPGEYASYSLAAGGAAGFTVHVVQGATPSVLIDTLGTAGVTGAAIVRGVGLLVRPNPSDGRLEMVAEMAARGRLILEVYDVAGRLVATPFDSVVPAGKQVVGWDLRTGGHMTGRAGLYFVRMQTGTRVVTRRCVVTP